MMHLRAPAVAKGLTLLFTVLWWWVVLASSVLVALVPLGLNVGVQIGPNGEPDFVAGSTAQMVLPVAFELDAGAAQVTSVDRRNSGAIERASGMLRLTTPDRPWFAVAGAAVMVGLVLWILAELAALCRSVRDGQPFAARNAMRIRRLALAVVLAEVPAPPSSTPRNAYVAAQFAADHLRFTASAAHRCARDCQRADPARARRGVPDRHAARRRSIADRLRTRMPIRVKLDHLMLDRRMTLTDLASRVDLTLANLSILKTNKARAIRFSTLDALCRELKCQPGDLLVWTAEEDSVRRVMTTATFQCQTRGARERTVFTRERIT